MLRSIEGTPVTSKPAGIRLAQMWDRSQWVADGTHRPVLGRKAHPAVVALARRRGVDLSLRGHNFKDSRGQYPEHQMNALGMKEVNSEQQKVFDSLAWINQQFFGDETPSSVTAEQAYEMSLMGVWLAAYLSLRGEKTLTRSHLPDIVSHLYNSAEGIRIAMDQFMKGGGDPNQSIIPADIYTIGNTPGEKDSSLLVEGAVVCPAPRQVIVDTSAALLYRTDAEPTRSELSRYISPDEIENAREFCVKLGKFYDNEMMEQDDARREVIYINLELGFIEDHLPSDHPVIINRKTEIARLEEKIRELNQLKPGVERDLNTLLGRDPRLRSPLRSDSEYIADEYQGRVYNAMGRITRLLDEHAPVKESTEVVNGEKVIIRTQQITVTTQDGRTRFVSRTTEERGLPHQSPLLQIETIHTHIIDADGNPENSIDFETWSQEDGTQFGRTIEVIHPPIEPNPQGLKTPQVLLDVTACLGDLKRAFPPRRRTTADKV